MLSRINQRYFQLTKRHTHPAIQCISSFHHLDHPNHMKYGHNMNRNINKRNSGNNNNNNNNNNNTNNKKRNSNNKNNNIYMYQLGSIVSVLLLCKEGLKEHLEDLIRKPQMLHLSGVGEEEREWKSKLSNDKPPSLSTPPRLLSEPLSSSSSSSSSPSSSSSSASPPSPPPPPPEERESYEDLQDEWNQQQSRYQREIEKLERENRELKRLLQTTSSSHRPSRRLLKSSLVDMYSQVLDSMSHYHNSLNNDNNNNNNNNVFGWEDQLPRVVVVGDQSAGKTSVLESLLQARVFPRGSGEMMTRAPVQVTVSEGAQHIAILNNNNNNKVKKNNNNNNNNNNSNNNNSKNNMNNNCSSSTVYDLSKEHECEALRKEIERRMKESVLDGSTISQETISMKVQGPGLQRMVLVDLPGIISTVTSDMAADTKVLIKSLCLKHMNNPNSIIVCVQDGSLDAERSNVTDLVRSADEEGRRTIFVLTKVDLAEKSKINPERVRQTLEGKLFPMKALAYFAVVTGRGNAEESMASIRKYEEEFFNNSILFKNGVMRSSQCGSSALSLEVSQLFWNIVSKATQQQLTQLKGVEYNLEAEWKNKYPKLREMDRGELFEKAKAEILDELVNLSNLPVKYWDDQVMGNLWKDVSEFVFDEVYMPAVVEEGEGAFNTRIDIKLKHWIDKILPERSLQVGNTTLQEEFYKLLTFSSLPPPDSSTHPSPHSSTHPSPHKSDDVFEGLKKAVFWEVKNRMPYNNHQTEETLRVLQLSTFEDRSVQSKEQWDAAVDFMKRVLMLKKQEVEEAAEELFGASSWKQWFGGGTRSEEQVMRRAIRSQLEKLFSNSKGKARLKEDDVVAVLKNMQASSSKQPTPLSLIDETWAHMYKKDFVERGLLTANDCSKEFYHHQQGFKDNSIDCSDVILFWRVERMLSTTSKAVRQHLLNCQNRRVEGVVKAVLGEIGGDEEAVKKLLTGERVQLAHHIRQVRNLIDQLEEFMHELNKAKA